jgi:hypothetical protein
MMVSLLIHQWKCAENDLYLRRCGLGTPASLPPMERYRWAPAYRQGRLVAGRVELTVDPSDDRIGLSPSERRRIAVRFLERVDPGLGDELAQLVRRRGAAGRRIAERLAPVEVVADDRQHGEQRFLCRLQPPQQRYGELREIEFGLHELERAP